MTFPQHALIVFNARKFSIFILEIILFFNLLVSLTKLFSWFSFLFFSGADPIAESVLCDKFDALSVFRFNKMSSVFTTKLVKTASEYQRLEQLPDDPIDLTPYVLLLLYIFSTYEADPPPSGSLKYVFYF